MLESSVVQRVIGAALRSGGDWAEVFVEDRRVSAGRLDDGKIEELTSGRDRGAGIRVVAGDTTGFAHTADLTEDGLRAAAEAAARGRPCRRRRRAARSRCTRQEPPAINTIAILPETVEKAAKIELLKLANESAPRRGRLDQTGERRIRRSAPPHPRRQQRRAAGRGRPGAHALRGHCGGVGRHRHADRLRVDRVHDGVGALQPHRRRADGSPGRASAPSRSCRRGPRRVATCRSCWPRAAAA